MKTQNRFIQLMKIEDERLRQKNELTKVMAARIEELEGHLAGVMAVLAEVVTEAETQDPFTSDDGRALLHGARVLLGCEPKGREQ